MMNICFITNKYPNPLEPNALVFLEQLVNSIATKGVECNVICPVPINIRPAYAEFPEKTKVQIDETTFVTVFFPKYIGFGQTDYGPFNPAKITTSFFEKAVERVIRSFDTKPDALYGHFVTPAGIVASRLGKKYSIPSFLAYGEATLNTIRHFGIKSTKQELQWLTGVVSVSSKNMKQIEEFVPKGITQVFPNAIDPALFYPRDKSAARLQYKLPSDAFVIAYVGVFDDLKGIRRLENSLSGLTGNVKLICAGSGPLTPVCKECVFHGPVLHSDLPVFLSAADVFVLPTLNEGCCNAIIEAMACGLPIISSKDSFNDDILDETNSIRIDSKDSADIQTAIKTLYESQALRQQLALGSLKKVQELTLSKRADRILDFIHDRISHES